LIRLSRIQSREQPVDLREVRVRLAFYGKVRRTVASEGLCSVKRS
jgi:hypothetical protein